MASSERNRDFFSWADSEFHAIDSLSWVGAYSSSNGLELFTLWPGWRLFELRLDLCSLTSLAVFRAGPDLMLLDLIRTYSSLTYLVLHIKLFEPCRNLNSISGAGKDSLTFCYACLGPFSRRASLVASLRIYPFMLF